MIGARNFSHRWHKKKECSIQESRKVVHPPCFGKIIFRARVLRGEKFVALSSNEVLHFSLQFRRGKWRLDIGRRCRRRWRCFTERGARSSDTAPEKGELPVPKRQRLRDVAEVDVSKQFHRQREVSSLIFQWVSISPPRARYGAALRRYKSIIAKSIGLTWVTPR